jgi:hypothetical protein
MLLQNSFIFEYTKLLDSVVADETLRFPARVNFIIQKNLNTFATLFGEINKQRMLTCEMYSTGVSEAGNFLFEDKEKRIQAENELSDLLNDTQEVTIKKFPLSAIEHLNLTSKQMEVLMFMIEDEEEEL